MIFNRHTVLLWMVWCHQYCVLLQNHPLGCNKSLREPPHWTASGSHLLPFPKHNDLYGMYRQKKKKKKISSPYSKKHGTLLPGLPRILLNFIMLLGFLNTQTRRHNSRQNSWTQSLVFGYVGELLNSYQFRVALA